MKSVILTVALLTSQIGFAQIKGSNFESRHQDMIQQEIGNKCGLYGVATLVSTTENVVRVDQGIQDVYFTTELNVQDTTDQYNSFDFAVIVKSVKADMYDHAYGQWGAYSVTSVSCVQK